MSDPTNPSFRVARRRQGMTAVLAMLYLMLFSALAVGFYSATTMSAQVSGNEQRGAKAQLAAESGMEFIRYQLAQTSIPAGLSDVDAVFGDLYADLQAELNGTGNLGARSISLGGGTISIPEIAADSDAQGAKFSATITKQGDGSLTISVTGHHRDVTITRQLQMAYDRLSRSSDIFNYAVASKGHVNVTKNALTGVPSSVVKIMSASPDATSLQLSGGSIGDASGGEIAVVSSASQANLAGTSVHGTSSATTIRNQYLDVVTPPEFPTIDTSLFAPYATNVYVAGGPYKNIRIPPNTNPQFAGGDVIQGIMYVQSPNTVTFRGNATIQGFIVFENAGTDATNFLDFSGSVNQQPLPAGAEFDSLRPISGYYLCAPTARVRFWGSFNATMNGSMICSKFDIGGAATATFNQGSLITMSSATDSATFEGSKYVKFNGTGSDSPPTFGLSYSQYFIPRSSSYREITQ